MLSKGTNIVLLCAILTNITVIFALLQVNISLLLFLDQRRRQNEEIALSAILDANLINLITRNLQSRTVRKEYTPKKTLDKPWPNFYMVG